MEEGEGEVRSEKCLDEGRVGTENDRKSSDIRVADLVENRLK